MSITVAFLASLTLGTAPDIPGTHTSSAPTPIDPRALVGLSPQEAEPTATAADASTTEDLDRALEDPSVSDAGVLAAKLSNPVADLISVPLQFNWDTGIGPKNSDRATLNVQPVIPISINEDWNVISRTIVPIIYAESPADGISSQFGLGDITQSLFFSPVEPVGGWVIGAGPVMLFPSGTDDLSRRQWGLGPTAVVLRQSPIGDGALTYGALVNHIWKLGGSNAFPDVNATFLQPFVSYAWKSGLSLTLNSESTYDWTGDQWTIPINALVGQVLRVGDQMMQLNVGGRWYAEAPDGGPEWGIRVQLTLLFPK